MHVFHILLLHINTIEVADTVNAIHVSKYLGLQPEDCLVTETWLSAPYLGGVGGISN